MNDWYDFGRHCFRRLFSFSRGFCKEPREPFSYRGQVFGRREVRTERRRIPERKRR